MIILGVTGKADKRIITYPLLKMCTLAGKTAVLTDDTTYRRLYEGYDNQGYIDNVEINIVPELCGENAEQIAQEYEERKREENFEYLIYISDVYISKNADSILALLEFNKTFLGWTIEELNETNPCIIPCIITSGKTDFNSKNDKNILNIVWKIPYFEYLIKTEERRHFIPSKDRIINRILEKAFRKSLSLELVNFKKLAKRSL